MRCLGWLLAALALTGCSADPDRSPAAEPADAAASPTDDVTEAVGNPLRFSGSGGRTVIACFPEGPRDLVTFDQLRARRPVTITGLAGGGEAMELRGSWVAPRAKDAIEQVGVIDLDAAGTTLEDVRGWSGRRPLRGAELEPGRSYVFFVRAAVRPDRRLDDLVVAWDDGTGTGTGKSRYGIAGHTRAGGC